MTPAINAAKKAKISIVVREYAHDPACASYGLEAAEKLGVDPERVFKTLIADLGDELVVAVIPVETMLGLKHLAKAAGAKKAAMADKSLVERTTGYVLGGVSPLGQKSGCAPSSTPRPATIPPFWSAEGDAASILKSTRRTWPA